MKLEENYLCFLPPRQKVSSVSFTSIKNRNLHDIFAVITHVVCLFAAVWLMSFWRANLYFRSSTFLYFYFLSICHVAKCYLYSWDVNTSFCLFSSNNFHYLLFYRVGTRHASLCCSDFVTLAHPISFFGVGKGLCSFVFMITDCLCLFEESVQAICL